MNLNRNCSNKKINPTGDKPVLILKAYTPAGYLGRSPLRFAPVGMRQLSSCRIIIAQVVLEFE
jgi:hypothetical protein